MDNDKLKTEPLEKRLEKPNRAQWLPIYGCYQIAKDIYGGKPTIIDKLSTYYVHVINQSASIMALGYALHKLC